MLLRKASAALAAGCSVVAKPSEETPLTSMAVAEVCSSLSTARLFHTLTLILWGVVLKQSGDLHKVDLCEL